LRTIAKSKKEKERENYSKPNSEGTIWSEGIAKHPRENILYISFQFSPLLDT
ncbi:Solute Carrier Family 35 Member E1, partial [Manis pentadactyla]